MSCPPWLTTEMEPNRKLFPDHLPFILGGALVGAGSRWPPSWTNQTKSSQETARGK
jgi:hypothetical protein